MYYFINHAFLFPDKLTMLGRLRLLFTVVKSCHVNVALALALPCLGRMTLGIRR